MPKQTRTFKNAEVNDSFSQILSEANDTMAANHVSILGGGIEEILSEDVLFEEYKEKLLTGCISEDAANLAMMFDNTREHILQESQMEGMKPFSSMSFPMQRKAWPRVGIINAIPTEPTDIPKFSISFLHPYVVDGNGDRQYLPETLFDPNNDVAKRLPIAVGAIDLPTTAPINLLDVAGLDARRGDAIDADFSVTKVHFEQLDASVTEIEVTQPMDSATGITRVPVEHEGVKDTAFIEVDRRTGELTGTSIAGKIVKVEVRAFPSTEANNEADEVGFDIDYKDLDVGTGRHIAAPLSTEWLQDMRAVYKIDGALKLVDIISEFLAQRLDAEGLEHIEAAYTQGQSAYGETIFTRSFDVLPPTQYSGSYKDWRSEVRTTINYVAGTMKNSSHHTSGHFNIVGNELDMDIITNVDWMFTAASGERSSVNVNYNVGAMSGSHKYNLLSTPNNPKGTLRMIYIPNTPDYTTLKYYPYAFNIENNNGYRDPNRPNLPAIVVNRRQIFDTIMPLVGKINIENNDGNFDRP